MGTKLFHADRQTVGHEEGNSRFWQLLRMCVKGFLTLLYQIDLVSDSPVSRKCSRREVKNCPARVDARKIHYARRH